MEKIKSFFKSCSNRQLRIIVAGAFLALVILVNPITRNSTWSIPVIGQISQLSSFLVLLGTWATLTAPDLREMQSTGFTLAMPDIKQMKVTMKAYSSTPKRPTNTQRRLDAQRRLKNNRRK